MTKKNKQEEMPIGTKDALMKIIDIDKFRATETFDASDDETVVKINKEAQAKYWSEVARAAYGIYLHSRAKKTGNSLYDCLSDLSDEDSKTVMSGVKLALEKKKEMPVISFREEYNREKIFIKPILAEIKGIGNGDVVRFKVGAYSIVREAEVVDIEGYNFSELFGVKVYADDIQHLFYLESVPTGMIEGEYTLEKIGSKQTIGQTQVNQLRFIW